MTHQGPVDSSHKSLRRYFGTTLAFFPLRHNERRRHRDNVDTVKAMMTFQEFLQSFEISNFSYSLQYD